MIKRISLNKLIFIFFILLNSVFVYAQQNAPGWCGFENLKRKYQIQKNSLFNLADSTYYDAISQINLLHKTSLNNNKIYQIPIVFHILYYKESENIADSVIYSQLDLLNKAFLSSDSLNIRREFRSVIGDVNIQFVLAKNDPFGNISNGIQRIKTSLKTFNTGDSMFIDEKMKFTLKGGVDAWNTDKYLNVWICNLTPMNPTINLILGYSYPPLNAKYWEAGFYKEKKLQGVVMHYRVIGSNNPQKLMGNSGYNTLVHEIGHFLGLKHIWGVNFNCDEGDYLDDTPFSSRPSFNCDFNKNTCLRKTNDLPDMVGNYMDYSTENCMKMFTQQQVLLMQYNLKVNRSELFNYFVTGKPDQEELNDIICIFPNPAQENIYLEKCLHDSINNPLMNCQIIDMLGNCVYNINLKEIITKINVSKFSPGIYSICIKYNEIFDIIRFCKK